MLVCGTKGVGFLLFILFVSGFCLLLLLSFTLLVDKLLIVNIFSRLVDFGFVLSFGKDNVLFFLVVSLVALIIFCYTMYYMEHTVYLIRFRLLFFAFLLSILILIAGDNMFFLFLG